MQLYNTIKEKLLIQFREVDGDENDFKDALHLIKEVDHPILHKFISDKVRASSV